MSGKTCVLLFCFHFLKVRSSVVFLKARRWRRLGSISAMVASSISGPGSQMDGSPSPIHWEPSPQLFCTGSTLVVSQLTVTVTVYSRNWNRKWSPRFNYGSREKHTFKAQYSFCYRTILARNPAYNFAYKLDRNFLKTFNKFVQTWWF